MKIRTDFVTNSSSSSFIISFKKTPEYEKIFKAIIDLSERRRDTIANTKEHLLSAMSIPDLPELQFDSSHEQLLYEKCLNKILQGESIVFLIDKCQILRL